MDKRVASLRYWVYFNEQVNRGGEVRLQVDFDSAIGVVSVADGVVLVGQLGEVLYLEIDEHTNTQHESDCEYGYHQSNWG